MPFFSHDNLEFHYLDRDSGVPVLFQHGLGGETEKTFALIQLPPGFRLLGMDCRAHGKTNPVGDEESLRFDSFGTDLVRLLDHLKIDRAVLGGTSMGAGVALNCALRFPQRVRGLILLRPAWLDEPNITNAKNFGIIAQLLRQHGPRQGLALFEVSEAYLAIARHCPDSAASLLALFSDPRALETVARLERVPLDAPNHNRAEWRQLTMPVFVLATEGDPIHPFEYAQVLAREIPGAQFRALTPKSVDLAQYTAELNCCLAEFLTSKFGTSC
jgi:pimeloyl-ACP methyl ester carboxylesterase